MQAKLKVSRFDPETMGQGQRRWDEFELDVHPSATVLDALIQIREEVDGTLSLRCACRASICGSCGMRVNGDAKLVSSTPSKMARPLSSNRWETKRSSKTS